MISNSTIIKLSLASFATHVDAMREKFSIRIETRYRSAEVSDDRKEISAYLGNRLKVGTWEMQPFSGFTGLNYTWFLHKEDALAFMLAFDGRIA